MKKSDQKKRRAFERRASEGDVQSTEGASPETARQGSVESPMSSNAQRLSSNDNPDEAESTEKGTVPPESNGKSVPDHDGVTPSESVDNAKTNVDCIFVLDI